MGGEFVNKLIVDRDRAYSKEKKTVHFLRYLGDQLAKRDIRKLVELIYRNFEQIATVKELNHNRREIARVLTSPQSIIIIGTLDRNIVSYLVAEVTVNNLRQFMHIYYLYTSPVHRGRGIAMYTLNLIQQYAQELGISTLSLTFDTYNKSLTKFYFENYFEYDPDLRSFQRYDMLVKYILE